MSSSRRSRRFLGPNELNQLDLVELVLTDETPNIAPVRAGLGAEARREGAVANGELCLVEGLVTVEIGQRHLGGGRQVEIEVLDVKRSSANFGSWPVPKSEAELTRYGGMISV